MSAGKIVVSLLWVACLGAFFLSPEAGWGRWGRMLFWVLAVAHLLECGFFYRTLRTAPGSLGANLVQTFLFGLLHVQEVRGQAG